MRALSRSRRLAAAVAALAVAVSAVAVDAGPASARPRRSGSCPQYEALLAAHHLPVAYFSQIMFRESGCRPLVRSRSHDTGLLQINDVTHRWLRQQLDAPVSVAWLKVPENNIAAAAVLYRSMGTRPWRTSR